MRGKLGSKQKIARFLAASVLLHAGIAALAQPFAPRPPEFIVPAPELHIYPSAFTSSHAAPAQPRSAKLPWRASAPVHPRDARFIAKPDVASDQATLAGIEPPAQSDPVNHLQSLMRAALDRYFVYPAVARRYGWEGRVGVALSVDREGRLNGLRVVHSSGYPILDQDAILTLKRVGVIPQARAWLAGKSYDTELPVVYKLIAD